MSKNIGYVGFLPIVHTENLQATAEYYGVWIKVKHDYLFPIIGDDVTIERTAVMRLEPEVE